MSARARFKGEAETQDEESTVNPPGPHLKTHLKCESCINKKDVGADTAFTMHLISAEQNYPACLMWFLPMFLLWMLVIPNCERANYAFRPN